eukprot:CAMPEP_0113883148 /NCGR_PEP_ID=MMETSP0780_2-20120614/9400_1 /TAXON_ID=652834 /ORGANISM="Palpitomonas bilix" /LENGTH=605 /DNA_ID=CAMNT_0000870343 /DNA_START=95 /DNA_END=1912 /DNA_ORIENTATION=+ /assembly_acc=CAM_ASM_000599
MGEKQKGVADILRQFPFSETASDPPPFFFDEVDEEEEASKKAKGELYSILNLPRNASDQDIRAAFKRLSLVYHPDRHSHSSEMQEMARERFTALQKAYEVLSDPIKRAQYDEEDNPDAEFKQLGPVRLTPDEMRDRLRKARMMEMQKESDLRVGHRSVSMFMMNVGKVAQRWRPVIDRFIIDHNTTLPFSEKDKLILHPSMAIDGARGMTSLAIEYERSLSPRSQLGIEYAIGANPSQEITLSRVLSSTSTMEACLSMNSGGPSFKTSFNKSISKRFLYNLEWEVRPGMSSAVSAGITSNAENHQVSVEVGLEGASISAKATAKKKLSDITTAIGIFRLGAMDLLGVEMGAQRRLTRNSSIQVSFSLSLVQGATVKILIQRGAHSFVFPLVISQRLSLRSVLFTAFVPSIISMGVKTLVLEPLRKRHERRRIEREKEMEVDHIEKLRENARDDLVLLTPVVKRKVDAEVEKGERGLIIILAVYGNLSEFDADKYVPPPNTRMNFTSAAARSSDHLVEAGHTEAQATSTIAELGLDSDYINVTTAVQYQVENSRLLLYATSKSGLPGFCDPCPGQVKHLFIKYLYNGKVMKMKVGESDSVHLPSLH